MKNIVLKSVSYDDEVDVITARLTSKKIHYTLELTEHILVDFSYDEKIVGIEILDASEEISKIFHRHVKREEFQKLLCTLKKDARSNEYIVYFRSPDTKETASVMITGYSSPLLKKAAAASG